MVRGPEMLHKKDGAGGMVAGRLADLGYGKLNEKNDGARKEVGHLADHTSEALNFSV